MEKMENIVKMIVKKYGCYREKEIMRHSYTIERAETWNTEQVWWLWTKAG